MNAQYKAILPFIEPCSAIFFTLHKSKIVMSMTRTNAPIMIAQYNGPIRLPVIRPNNHKNKDNSPTPIPKPRIPTKIPFIDPFVKKEISDINKNAKDVIPNVIPNNDQGMNKVKNESEVPIKMQYKMPGMRMECFPLAVIK